MTIGSEKKKKLKANPGSLRLGDMSRAIVLYVYVFNALICNFKIRAKLAVILFF